MDVNRLRADGAEPVLLQIALAIPDRIRYNSAVRHRSKRQGAECWPTPRPYAGDITSHTAE